MSIDILTAAAEIVLSVFAVYGMYSIIYDCFWGVKNNASKRY